jgi:hypothetical protein
VHFDDRTVGRHRFDFDVDDLLFLQRHKDAVQHPCLGPAIHPRVDRMPVAEPAGQASPLAALLGHIQDRVHYSKIGDAYIAALSRKTSLNPSILFLGDFHHPYIQHLTE